jgi:serine/threonine-protein kinase
MVKILSPFCGEAINHTMLPLSGGMDIIKVSYDAGNRVMEFWPSHRVVYVGRPEMLEFRYFKSSPIDSFFLLTNRELEPSGVYEDFSGNYEEVLELANGEQMDRSCLDAGYIGHDENGFEIPIPDDYRLVVRFLDGKFLMVAKKSIWNQVSSTYDGRHSRLSASEIQQQIGAALSAIKDRSSRE